MKIFWATAVLSTILSLLCAFAMAELLSDQSFLYGGVGLYLSSNTGIAFGIPLPTVVIIPLVFGALGFVFWLVKKEQDSQLTQIAFGLILGGGIANLIDRIPDGAVTDYFKVGSFPVFNLADSCITVGVALLLLSWLFLEKKAHKTI